MIRRLRALRLLLLPPLLALAACTVNPATGRESFTGFMSKEDEVRVGADEHPKLVKEFGGEYGHARLQEYVSRIGAELVRHVEVKAYPYTFTVLNDDKVNAFALPGGYVHVTRGLLALAENEAEMAGVLAHEIGHVVARHSAERYSAVMATNLGMIVFGVIGSAAGLPADAGRLIGYGAQAALQSYSREQELEADMLGVRYMARAGYDPRAMTSFFLKMKAHAELERALAGKQNEPAPYNIMSTHPRTEQRIDQAIGLARQQVVAEPTVNRDAYLDAIDGMVFGDDPGQGVRRGRLFQHPDLGIQFQVPPGFRLFNSPRQVVARGPEQSAIVFDMASPRAAREAGSLRAYVADVWARNIGVDALETLDVNGLEAATAKSRVSTQSGPRDVRLVAVRGGPEQIFRFAFISHPAVTGRYNVEFRRTTFSFRRLTPEEAARITPLKVRVVTAGDDDTPAALAKRMPFEDFALDWFRVLNGLRPGQGIQPGLRVKVVSP